MAERLVGGLRIRRTSAIFDENSRICTFVYAPPGEGKTRLGATLDKLTRKYLGKPTLYILFDPGEGAGGASIRKEDVEYVEPSSVEQMDALLHWLAQDTTYGGVSFDPANEYAKSVLLPYSLAMPARENPLPRQKAGVPSRDDYQNMGEMIRRVFNSLINLTTVGGTSPTANDIARRKHLYVACTQKEKYDNNGNLTVTQPDLPGASADTALAMFQTTATLRREFEVVPDPKNPKVTTRVPSNWMYTHRPAGKYVVRDKFGLLPERCEGDLCVQYEKYWLPAIAARKEAQG